jgi:hypothetical protein
VLSSPVLSEWPMQLEPALLVAVLTWSALVFELAFPMLIWDRRFRPYALAAGTLFHLGIELTLTIPMFSAVMLVSYVSFLSDDEAERALAFLRRLWRPSRLAAAQQPR